MVSKFDDVDLVIVSTNVSVMRVICPVHQGTWSHIEEIGVDLFVVARHKNSIDAGPVHHRIPDPRGISNQNDRIII
jgi:hypothetical protein